LETQVLQVFFTFVDFSLMPLQFFEFPYFCLILRSESGDVFTRRKFIALHLGHAGGQVGRVRSGAEEVLWRIPLGHRQAYDPPALHLLSLPLSCCIGRHLELGI
jgi:hypothetical protein